MTDLYSKEKRSQIMARIKSTNSKPERKVRSLLHGLGYRFRLHDPKLPGKPDIVLPKYKKVIFVHGCFWHGHSDCKLASLPSTNTAFWSAKIETNKLRDIKVSKMIQDLGWNLYIVWQCQLKNMEKLTADLESFIGR